MSLSWALMGRNVPAQGRGADQEVADEQDDITCLHPGLLGAAARHDVAHAKPRWSRLATRRGRDADLAKERPDATPVDVKHEVTNGLHHP